MTNAPKIELRSISHNVRLSEETAAYTAKVFVDGVHFCDVSNPGQGGCDMQYPPKGKENGFNDRLAALEERIKATMPPIDISYMYRDGQPHTMEQSFELICHELVEEAALTKEVKRDLSKKVLWKQDGKVFQIKVPKGGTMDGLMAHVKAKYKIEKTLNEMPLADAVAAYKAMAQ